MIPANASTRLVANGAGYWEVRWNEGARSHAISTRTKDRAVAEVVRRSLQAVPGGALSGDTIGGLLDGYRASAEGRRVGKTDLRNVATLKSYLGALPPETLTPGVVLDYRRRRGISDSAARRELKTLTAALRWGYRHRLIVMVPYVELPPESDPRVTWLREDVEAELWLLASQDEGPDGRLSRAGRFICLGLATGARKSAIEGLEWDRIDVTHGVIDYRDPLVKQSAKRRVATPVQQRLVPVLERMRRERRPRDSYALDSNSGIDTAWDRFMTRHGFEDVTPHVLRHTRCTLALRAGVSVWDVAALVGASPETIHKTYGHWVSDGRLKAEANRRYAAPTAVPTAAPVP